VGWFVVFLARVHLGPTLLEAYGEVPGEAWLVLDAVLQALESEREGLFGVELSSASLVVEPVVGDPVVLLLDETRAEVVAEGVRRALEGGSGVWLSDGGDAGWVVEELSSVSGSGFVTGRLDVLGRDWCVLGAGTALAFGEGVGEVLGRVRPGEVWGWDAFGRCWSGP
jgi:hypothetical protein